MPPPSVPLDAIPLPALLYGADGRIAAANDLAEALVGRRLAGCTAGDVVRAFGHRRADGSPLAPSDLPACRALAGDEAAAVPLSITAADGRTVEMVATASPVRDGDAIAGALVVLQDVTARVRAEGALAESEAQYRALFETMNEGFMVVEPVFDEHGAPVSFRHLEVNPAKARLSGRTREELVGRDARETAPGVEDRFVEPYARVAATGEPAHLEAHARGLGRWLSVDVYSPEPGRAAVVVSDITARKEAEERQAFLLALGDRLRELDDVAAIAAEAAERVGRHLGASGAVYCEIDGTGEYATVRADWTDGTVPPATGRFCLDDFGIGDLYRRGGVRRTADVAAELGRDEAERHSALEIRASLGVPVLRSGKLAAVLAVHSTRPREWTDAEVELVRQAGGRTVPHGRLRDRRALPPRRGPAGDRRRG